MAALAEGLDEGAELWLGGGGKSGFAGGVAEGELFDAIEIFAGGALADTGELQAVQQEGKLCGAADALGDERAEDLGDERHDLGGGVGEALAGGLEVRGVKQGGVQVAVVGGVAGGEICGDGVKLQQLPLGGWAGEPGEAREGGGGGAAGQDEGETGDVASGWIRRPGGGFAAVGKPEDAEGEDAIDGGGGFGFVDGNDGAGGVGVGAGAEQQAAGVRGAERFFEIHGGAKGVGVPVWEVALKGALEDGEVAGADGFAGRGAAAGLGGGSEIESLGAGCAEALGAQAQGGGAAGLGGEDGADDVAGVIPKLERAAIVGGGERAFGGAEVEEDFALFEGGGLGVGSEEGSDEGGELVWRLLGSCRGRDGARRHRSATSRGRCGGG